MESELILLDICPPTKPAQDKSQDNPQDRCKNYNKSLEIFNQNRQELFENMDPCDELMTRLYETHIIGLAEKESAQSTSNEIIKRKIILTAIGTMIRRSPYHERMLRKVSTILKEQKQRLPRKLDQVNKTKIISQDNLVLK